MLWVPRMEKTVEPKTLEEKCLVWYTLLFMWIFRWSQCINCYAQILYLNSLIPVWVYSCFFPNSIQSEFLITESTIVFLFTSVYCHVLIQICPALKLFTTFKTIKIVTFCVLYLVVYFQSCTCYIGSITTVAFVIKLTCVQLHMNIQAQLTLEPFATYLTFKILDICVFQSMSAILRF